MRTLVLFVAIAMGCGGNDGQWWCSTNVCTRTEKECAGFAPKETGEKCKTRRIAFCPVDGANSLQCTATLDACEERVAKMPDGFKTRCVGVE
jgi:hypothetical protein